MGTATAIAPSTVLNIEKSEMFKVLHEQSAFSDKFIPEVQDDVRGICPDSADPEIVAQLKPIRYGSIFVKCFIWERENTFISVHRNVTAEHLVPPINFR
jgi:hypothetical protein